MTPAPAIDDRRAEAFFRALRRYAPHYAPEWDLSDEQDAGGALLRIFAHLAETVTTRLDRTPKKNFVAFLDKLGIGLLAAGPARAAVTFRLASALEEPVRVPPGTRVTAPGEEDEIPFETTAPLFAIPAKLQAAYGVDPGKDVIFRPPPGFLRQEPRARSELTYEIASFVDKGSERIQLDNATGLQAGAFLKIGRDRAIVELEPKETIIKLTKPVKRNYPAGTLVTPIQDFEVFNGIDLQEHTLYLGDSRGFDSKEESKIKLQVLLDSAASGLKPLDLTWQFWTEDEDDEEKGEHWHDLVVESDGTVGLTTGGEITLRKTKLEIKERKVNDGKNRWIRAVANEKLPVGDGRFLPRVDTIKVALEAGPAEGIPADQGFHNATPLDLQVKPGVGFFPFGAEPRQFDQFYIASEEAFSKRGADVRLDFHLDLQTLAAPAAVSAGGNARVYSIGLRRRLYELDLKSGDWDILGDPSNEPSLGGGAASFLPVEDSVPSAVVKGDNYHVFVNTKNAISKEPEHGIWMHHRLGATKRWAHLGSPLSPGSADNPIPYSPAALVDGPQVFVVAGDGNLYSSVETAEGRWTSHGSPSGVSLRSSPFVVAGGSPRVYATGDDRKVHELTVASGNWLTLEPLLGQSFKAFSRPFAQAEEAGGLSHRKVFVFGYEEVVGGAKSWQLRECHVKAGSTGPFDWVDLGSPTSGLNALFDVDDPDLFSPRGFVEQVTEPDLQQEGKHIFLRGADNRLYERLDSPPWRVRSRPDEAELRGSPAVIHAGSTADRNRLQVFSASGRNSIVRWTFEEGLLPPNPTLLFALLAAGASEDEDAYKNFRLDIVRQTGETQIREIVAYDGAHKAIRVGAKLDFEIDSDCQIRILEQEGSDLKTVDAETPAGAEIDLPGQTTAIKGKVIDIKGERRLVVDFVDPTATVDPPFTAPVPAKSIYTVHSLIHEETGSDRNKQAIALHNLVKDGFVGRATQVQFADEVQLNDVSFYSRHTGVVALRHSVPTSAVAGEAYALFLEPGSARTEYGAPEDSDSVPELSWEYWNGRGWLSLPVSDGTRNLLSDGLVTFKAPETIEPTEVAGQESFWIRARLVGGDYGRETFKIVERNGEQEIVSEKSSLRPPKVTKLRIHYDAQPTSPEACLTFNNLDYLDQTAACRTPGAHFPPFEKLEDKSLTLYFGFDKPFKTGPVRLLFDSAEREVEESNPPELGWSFRRDRLWKELSAEDGSQALTRQGVLTLNASDELTPEQRFNKSLHWIRGSLDKNRYRQLPLLYGVFLNTVWAEQGETITNEIVASSDGEPDQKHTLQNPNVLDGQEIRVREFLSAEEREQLQRKRRKKTEVIVVEPEGLEGTWVLWNEIPTFIDCGKNDRCYKIDRATGMLQFGDGKRGLIPPASVDNIMAFRYRTGGGAHGNVAAGRIEALATAVAGVESVFNPTAAGGGSDTADLEEMLTIGPRRISHRNRAVSAEDFEELAYEASRKVAKARCLAATRIARRGPDSPDPCDPGQRHRALDARGWVSLIIVPHSEDDRPCPTLELRRSVADFLEERAASLVSARSRIVVRPPDYVVIQVRVDVFAATIDKASEVERLAKEQIRKFLHPLRGGPEGEGWDFGRTVWASDVYAVLERIADVDRLENLELIHQGVANRDRVEVAPNRLPAGEDHQIRVHVGGGA